MVRKDMEVDYLLRLNHRDRKSVAFDMEVDVKDLTPEIVREWVTMLLCDELKALRHARTTSQTKKER